MLVIGGGSDVRCRNKSEQLTLAGNIRDVVDKAFAPWSFGRAGGSIAIVHFETIIILLSQLL